jgi:hypothetical protein
MGEGLGAGRLVSAWTVERRCSGLGRVAAAVGSCADREAVVRRVVRSGMRRWGREGEGLGGRNQ